MSRIDPSDLLDEVNDQESFLRFVRALIEDRLEDEAKEQLQPSSSWGSGANGWKNGSVVAFLEAATRWAEDSDMGERQGLPPGPSWKAFAVFLYCGKIYE